MKKADRAVSELFYQELDGNIFICTEMGAREILGRFSNLPAKLRQSVIEGAEKTARAFCERRGMEFKGLNPARLVKR